MARNNFNTHSTNNFIPIDMSEFEDCKIKVIPSINEAAKLLTEVSLKWEGIPDELQADIDRWMGLFVARQNKY